MVTVKFTNTNSASSATLAIGSTAAKPIRYKGSATSSGNTWAAGEIVVFIYDGTNYESIAYSGPVKVDDGEI